MRLMNILASTATMVTLFAATPSYADVLTSPTGYGNTYVLACSSAKRSAEIAVIRQNGTVTGFSECDCSDSGANTMQRWICTVDAYYRERD